MSAALLELLQHGFTADYIPPDIASRAAHELTTSVQTAIGTRTQDTTAISIARRLREHVRRLETTIAHLAPVVNAPTTATDAAGRLVTLPSADDYLAALAASPTLPEAQRLRLFESHHLSGRGSLLVFVYEDARRLREELRTALYSPSLAGLVRADAASARTTLDPADPASTLLDYYYLKSVHADRAICAIEQAVAQQPSVVLVDSAPRTELSWSTPAAASGERSSRADLVADISAAVSPASDLARASALMAAVAHDREILQRIRAALKLLSATATADLYTLIVSARNYVMRQAMRTVNQQIADGMAKLYSAVISPLLQMILGMETHSRDTIADILRRIRKVNKRAGAAADDVLVTRLHEQVFESVFKQVYQFQDYFTGLALEDEQYYAAHSDKTAKLADVQQLHWSIAQLDRAIALLDEAHAAGDMSEYLEAYALDTATEAAYDWYQESKTARELREQFARSEQQVRLPGTLGTPSDLADPAERANYQFNGETLMWEQVTDANDPRTADEIINDALAEWDRADDAPSGPRTVAPVVFTDRGDGETPAEFEL